MEARAVANQSPGSRVFRSIGPQTGDIFSSLRVTRPPAATCFCSRRAQRATSSPGSTTSSTRVKRQSPLRGIGLPTCPTRRTRHEVYIRPLFDTGAAPVRVSSSGGREPRWAADGSELFFRAEDELFVSQIESEPSQLRAGRPGRLFRNRALAFQPHPTSTTAYNVSPDGRFLMVEDAPGSQGPQIVAVLNWVEELKARVPTN